MSGSDKSIHSHVRFRDGDDLVEFEGGRNPPSKTDVGENLSNSKRLPSPAAKPDPIVSKIKSHKIAQGNDKAPQESIPTAAADVSVAPVKAEEDNKDVDELKLKYFSAFQTINRVHGGAIMKIKVGVAGATPAKDSFPMFGATKKWTCLHWDADSAPSQWCVAYYSEPPAWFDSAMQAQASPSSSSKHGSVSTSNSENIDDLLAGGNKSHNNNGTGPGLIESSLYPLPDVSTASKAIYMREISDLYLEVAPSVAFRLYCGKEVIHFTPVNAYNVLSKRSSCWADSIYSALALLQEPDLELVQLYKQEFVSVLQQHAADHQQSRSDGTVGDSGGNSTSGGETGEAGTQQAAPRTRPAMMRRRSTLSSFLGITASKPLKDSAFDDNESNKYNATGEQGEGQQSEAEEESPSAHTKSSFFSAVNKVRSAIKLTLLSTRSGESDDNSNETNRMSGDYGFKRTWLLDRKVSVIKHKRPSYYQQQNAAPGMFSDGETGDEGVYGGDGADTQENSTSLNSTGSGGEGSGKHGQPDKAPATQTPPPGSANFLSQSLLRMHSKQDLYSTAGAGRSGSPGASASASASASNKSGANASASDLQAKVDELLFQNRLLQQQLHNGGTVTSTTPLNVANNTSLAAEAAERPAPPPQVEYTPKELTTLRAFTARTNFLQNKNAQKNAARAFGSSDSKLSDLQKLRKPSPTNKGKTEPPPVLGKATVLDRLLSQQAGTELHKGAEEVLSYEGDDYYNDTIELDPLSIVQLIELHKLQQVERLRERSDSRGSASDGEGAGASEAGLVGEGVHEGVVASPQSKHRRRGSAATATRNSQQQELSPVHSQGSDAPSGVLAMEAANPESAISSAGAPTKPPPSPGHKKVSLGSGIQSHTANAAITAPAPLTAPVVAPALQTTQPSLTSALSAPGSTSASTRPKKKSVNIAEQQLQATTQRELRLLNLLTAPDSPAPPPASLPKPRGYSVESEHKSDSEHRMRAGSDSSGKGQNAPLSPTGVSVSAKVDLPAKSKGNNKAGGDTVLSEPSVSRPQPSVSSPVKFGATYGPAAAGDNATTTGSPDRVGKPLQRRQLGSNSDTRSSTKVAKVGSGLLAAAYGGAQPRLSIGTVESDRHSDSKQQQGQGATKVRPAEKNDIVRTAKTTEIVRTPPAITKMSTLTLSEAGKIAKNTQTAPQEVSNLTAKAAPTIRDGSLNMRPLAYDSGTDGVAECSATVTDIESLKAPKWSNSYFYANNSARREVKRVRKGRLSVENGGQNSPHSELFSKNNSTAPPSWEAFLAGLPAAHVVHAVGAEGGVICLLLTQRELHTALLVCNMTIHCANSKVGVLKVSHQQDARNYAGTEGHFMVLVQPAAEALVFVPLSDVASAELDTNSTGLFKLTMDLACLDSATLNTVLESTSSTSLVRTLATQVVSAEETTGRLRSERSEAHRPVQSVPRNGATEVEYSAEVGRGGLTGTVRSVVLVLKATEILPLVEWLTALMDLRL